MFVLPDGLLGIFESLYFFALHISGSGAFPKTLSRNEEVECLRVLSWEKRHRESDQNVDLDCPKKNESYTEEDVRAAKDKLVTHNLRLVAHVIKKYYAAYSDQDDLISIGTIGLIKGINSFDPDKGTKLATYAARCIENEILMYFRSQKNKQQYVLMGEPIDMDSDGNPLTIMDVICDESDMAEDVELKIKTEQVLSLVSGINDKREKEIIILRYGLNNQKPLTQREVAKLLGISRSYVSRIEKKVLENLRAELE